MTVPTPPPAREANPGRTLLTLSLLALGACLFIAVVIRTDDVGVLPLIAIAVLAIPLLSVSYAIVAAVRGLRVPAIIGGVTSAVEIAPLFLGLIIPPVRGYLWGFVVPFMVAVVVGLVAMFLAAFAVVERSRGEGGGGEVR